MTGPCTASQHPSPDLSSSCVRGKLGSLLWDSGVAAEQPNMEIVVTWRGHVAWSSDKVTWHSWVSHSFLLIQNLTSLGTIPLLRLS